MDRARKAVPSPDRWYYTTPQCPKCKSRNIHHAYLASGYADISEDIKFYCDNCNILLDDMPSTLDRSRIRRHIKTLQRMLESDHE